MRQLCAILGDSLREVADRRALTVLLLLESVLVLMTFSLSFEGGSPTVALERQARTLHELSHHGPGSHTSTTVDARFTVGAARAADDGELPGGFAVGVVFESVEELDKLVREWRTFRRGPLAELTAGGDPAGPPVVWSERSEFLRARFLAYGYSEVSVRLTREERPEADIAVRSAYPFEVRGRHALRLGFGLVQIPLSDVSVAELVVLIQLGLADTFAGFLGMVVAIVVTAGFVPGLLQKGTLDLALARPIRRPSLLLFKYLGGLWFVFILASWLVAGTWLGLSVRTGFVNPWYLLSVLTVSAQFAVLYSVSVLAGVLWRSAGLASLLTLCIWGASSAVVGLRHALGQGAYRVLAGDEAPRWLSATVEVLYGILPKTADLKTFNTLFLARSHLSPEALKRTFAVDLPPVDWVYSLGTTAAFAFVMLALAAWVFQQRDH